MLKVALTGNIASGKSSVARVWRSLGAPVVDADELARRAVEPGSPALAEIVAQWGGRVLDSEGTLDRAALREIVFGDSEARARLEAIVHPAVAAQREAEFRRLASADARIAIADIPLLFEVGLQEQFDQVVLVDAPEDVRLQRLVQNRGLTPDAALRMIEAQMPAEQKRPRADIVIENVGTQEELRARAGEVWRELCRKVDAERGERA